MSATHMTQQQASLRFIRSPAAKSPDSVSPPLSVSPPTPQPPPPSSMQQHSQSGYNSSNSRSSPSNLCHSPPLSINQVDNMAALSPKSRNNIKEYYQHHHHQNGGGGGVSNYEFSQFTATVPTAKKSFCIDALLSKKQSDNMNNSGSAGANSDGSNNNLNKHQQMEASSSPPIYLTTEEALRQFNDDKGDFVSSPDEEVSRSVDFVFYIDFLVIITFLNVTLMQEMQTDKNHEIGLML